MDEWHRKVAGQLVVHARGRGQTEGESALEIAFGRVRAAVTYLLEFARAHRVAVIGHVAGDDIWVQLGGGARVRCTLNRRDAIVVLRVPDQDGRVLRWDPTQAAIVDGGGGQFDLVGAAHAALEALVAEWAARPALEEPRGAAPREFEDEPTKG
jgi:hypothetical protein